MNPPQPEEDRCAGIVLAGGSSRRMVQPKAWLPFGPERMLARVVRLLSEVVRPVVVAAGAGQEVSELPPWCRVVYDSAADQGPMEGLAAAMEFLQAEAELVFVAGCDTPLLAPGLVRRIIALADGFDAAVPHLGGIDHPLTAVYRTRLAAKIKESLALGSRRMGSLLDAIRTRRVAAEELIDVDPCLLSVANINTPAEYLAALREAGLFA